MSNTHIRAMFESTGMKPATKLVGLALADRACMDCGCAWPGRQDLMDRTGLGRTSVDDALRELQEGGHVVAIANARGGRGRAVIYIVLPALEGMKAAPCRDCQARMVGPVVRELAAEKPAATRAVSGEEPAATRHVSAPKPTATRAVSPKPTAGGPGNIPPRDCADSPQLAAATNGCEISAARQPSVNPETSARARVAPARERRAESAPPTVIPPPGPTCADALRAMWPDFTPGPALERIPMVTRAAATAPDRATAQPLCRPTTHTPRRAGGPVPIGDAMHGTLAAAAAPRARPQRAP